jgi:FtsZ-binding cell division protein ZapB
MFVLWLLVSMDAHSVVDDWDTARFDGGFRGLEELEARGFSGAVEAAGNWLFFSDGDPLAVVSDLESVPQQGDIDAFEGADGRTHEAQTPWVAAVAAMLALDGEVRGRYFTADTPLEAVHETLSDGGFTGYVELSENVLSGDYYFVYLDGEVGHVGFVGGSQWLLGEEAETKAKSEIGIYAVTAVSLPRPELPDPPATETDRSDPAVADAPETTTDAGEPADSDSDVDPGADAESEPEDSTPDATAADAGSETETSAAEPDAEPAADRTAEATEESADRQSEEPADNKAESDDQSDAAERSATAADSGDAASEATDEALSDDGPDAGGDRSTTTSESATAVDPRRTAGSTPKTSQRNSSGIESVTTRTVPSLDPENTGRDEPEQTSPPASAPGSGSATSEPSSAPNGTPSSATGGQSTGSETHARSQSSERSEAIREEYEARIEEQAEQIETYESEIDDLEAEIDDLEAELGDADSRIEELETELESIERERDELEERLEASGGAARERSLSRAEALSETSLFARAIDKGETTLEDAHGGGADREAIDSNLRIEYHTEFEDRNATVEGEPFEAWLRSSDAHAFAEWLVTDLFFEIRSTGATAELGPLYDALPMVDRIGFEETLRVGDGADGREVAFDIVARNKKGNPLVVVLFDRQRDPTRAEAIEPLVTDASDVCEAYDSLAGAVAITSSYFESDARAAVEEATSSSLLSRSKHRSYVNLSRTSGYHLCLVEYRDGSFNLTHPEL